MKGIIFDIKEFALNDGDGIRTTIFLKGCPLRCVWCHNPEGLSAKPEIYVKSNGCLNCGLCHQKCDHEECQPFGRCIHICPRNLVSISGEEWDSELLAEKLLRHAEFFKISNGGITLSGGEPLFQAKFCLDLLKRLRGKIHRAIETSGYSNFDTFKETISECDLVIMDIKLADTQKHLEYTGGKNEYILKNAEHLKNSGIPHVFRIPLIPNITDTEENLIGIASIVSESKTELLPYNPLASAKYKGVGRTFTDKIDESLASKYDTAKLVSFFSNATVRK